MSNPSITISKESVAHIAYTTPIETIPGDATTQLRIIKRNGTVMPYDEGKIIIAMTKAFLAVEGNHAAESTRIREIVQHLTGQITRTFLGKLPSRSTLHIEDIQDQVEFALMCAGEQPVARAYVLYREERTRNREKAATEQKEQSQPALHVTTANGKRELINKERLEIIVKEACQGLSFVSAEPILKETYRNIFDGIPEADVSEAITLSARTLVENEPNYSYVTARLLLDSIRREALSFLNITESATHSEMRAIYPAYFKQYIAKGISLKMLDPKLNEFDLEKLGQALVADNDNAFSYLGLQTLYDRYFIHKDGIRYELPQAFFMRVAMGLALEETNKNEKAIEFYQLLSQFDYMSSTPTLFNSGTLRPQLSSCFLTTVKDDLFDIYGAIRDNAMLSKFAGGLGNDWTPVRAMGSHIEGTNGKSLGVVPFLNVANATAVAVNQGGKRKGAVCAYLETWHLDIEEFLELRKNTGDERRRTHDMNTANWIPDLFMQRVIENKEWTLFSPNEVPELHETFGKTFEQYYRGYEEKAARGEIKTFKTISAVKLWRKMLGMLFETGHPWITFKDPCNIRSPQQHVGVIHSSNLCTEITLNTSQDEIAVCNLGSINLAQHIENGQLNKEKLAKTVKTAIRMLDNVIDINYYAVPQARNSNLKHRPIGLGIMGFQDALYQLRIEYTSPEAVHFADTSMELISYLAIQASSDLAAERGTYQTYPGSLWDQGILPIDSLKKLAEIRGPYLEADLSQTLDWNSLRNTVKKQGMRNSNVMAIAPTATISNICGVSQSIEPTYQNLYVKSNLSGEFTVINPYLVRDLKERHLWDSVMINDLKYFDGSVQKIDRIPADLKKLYAGAFEIDPSWLVECGARRQKWIDQAQSLNLYIAEVSGKKLDALYKLAWTRGLKTTYYARSLGATNAEKSTVTDGALNAVTIEAAPKACLIDDPTCEACQ